VRILIKTSPYVEELIEKYKEILSISDEKILVACNLVDAPNQAKLFWDKPSKTWTITHNNNVVEFILVEQLGHIYFNKKTASLRFDFNEDDPEIDMRLYPLLNNLLMCFENYNLTLFDDIYPLYREMVGEYLDKIEIFKQTINRANDPILLLSWYILYFLDFNYLIKKPDREERSSELTELIVHLKNNLLNFSSVISDSVLDKITEKLKNFDNVKSSIDSETIIHFFIDVLQATTLWEESTLIKQVKLYFPKIEL
jgi:hypothetical protein